MNCCAHHNLPAGCNQGRDCPKHSGFPPLHRLDGGHVYRDGMAFPIEREEDDAPLMTPESAAEPVPGIAQAIAGFIVLVFLAVSAFVLPALLSH